MHSKRWVVLGLALLNCFVWADEGMWTFDALPKATLKETYGFEAPPTFWEHMQLASLRIAGGCSASFVSPQGLVMTNHHCAVECVEHLSSRSMDYVKNGFWAPKATQEKRCPDMELNQLIEITDVTQSVKEATLNLYGLAFKHALNEVVSTLKKDCQSSPQLRCEMVNLYRGGFYHLYKYQKYSDVRLVFAPEAAVAFFGGDLDNFSFPRYDLDVSFLRVYAENKPLASPHYFKWSFSEPQEGDLAFVSGNPGGTSRLLTAAQLRYVRDHAWPRRIARLSELRAMLKAYSERGPEEKRTAATLLFSVENSLKVIRGRHAALADRNFFSAKAAAERALQDKVNASAEWKDYASVWTSIENIVAKQTRHAPEYLAVEDAFRASTLFGFARALLRAAEEREKPNASRLSEYSDANLPNIETLLTHKAPLYPKLETALLRFELEKIREALGVDHPFVKTLLGKDTPARVAARLVSKTQLADVKVRKKLWEGGAQAIAQSKDAMLLFAKLADPHGRAIRKIWETEVETPATKEGERLAQLRFQLLGASLYPDATFTLRLSYGQVKGYEENGRPIPPLTRMGGLFERATDFEPFLLPARWKKAKARLNLNIPLNMVTTHDIIGGNSGSPILNAQGEVIGLVFDGNIQSLGGDYVFDAQLNRTVAVQAMGIVEALDKVYGAERLLTELREASKTTPAAAPMPPPAPKAAQPPPPPPAEMPAQTQETSNPATQPPPLKEGAKPAPAAAGPPAP
ncbi:MAG: S46 family peptidase [Cystobacterineae bacterium]|nr:S46 family peptidase [Cystobacterineae bacterium]